MNDIQTRVDALERQVRSLKRVLAAAVLLPVLLAVAAWSHGGAKVLRAQALIIVDSAGRERIVMGAPVPEPRGLRRSPSTGMVIRDPRGVERFGVGLLDTGGMIMGFDAPAGTGGGANRERITLNAGATGGAELRFLNQNALVAAHMALFDAGDVALFFTNYSPRGTLVHRVSAEGDTVVLHPR